MQLLADEVIEGNGWRLNDKKQIQDRAIAHLPKGHSERQHAMRCASCASKERDRGGHQPRKTTCAAGPGRLRLGAVERNRSRKRAGRVSVRIPVYFLPCSSV
jgi:hypothetical protein